MADLKHYIYNPGIFLMIVVGCGVGGGEVSWTNADGTAPTVSSTSPANNDTGFAVNSAITATFSEIMDASTITAATFTLNNGVTGIVTYTGVTATFTPSSNLAYSTTYTATISTGVKDAAGNAMAGNYTWTFATGTAPDTTPPTVSSTSPADNATGVAVNTAITATFSETMDASTVTAATFSLNKGVTGTVAYTGTTATFTPSSNLAYSTIYTATITTDVKDAAGNAMTSPYTWTFTTGTEPDTTPPTVSSTSPADNATGVAVNTAITATFNETMTASTITTATFTLLNVNGATLVSGNVNYTGVTATFTPLSNLFYTAPYTATISTGVKDSAGNAMTSPYTWTFTTGTATATLTWTAPTTTMDGSPLTGDNIITKYKVYYGTLSGNYTTVKDDVGTATTYTVTGLSGGTTYYFAVAAVNSVGESGYSNEVSKTIP